jgi:membrane protein
VSKTGREAPLLTTLTTVPGRNSEASWTQSAGGLLRRGWHTSRKLFAATVAAALRYRLTGLAAEAAFFGVLSLPPLVFGLAGAIGFVANRFDVVAVRGFRSQVLELASQALTDETVQTIIQPTVDEVLSGGRFDIISIGFVIALWSGSRALNVLVDAITIMYGLAGRRGIIRTRALSFGLYVLFLLVGVVVLPLVLAGPVLVDSLLRPVGLQALGQLYWPIVLIGAIGALTTLFHVAVPVRTRWRAELPGAVLTLLIWLGGSALLRLILTASAGTPSIYGPLAAPIALLVWLYVICLAILIGAAFNAAVDVVWQLSGIPHEGPVR